MTFKVPNADEIFAEDNAVIAMLRDLIQKALVDADAADSISVYPTNGNRVVAHVGRARFNIEITRSN